MIVSAAYTENGVEKEYDQEAYIKKLKETHYIELKNLIRKAMGARTQVEFARDIGMDKGYLNRILKEGSDIIPSKRMLKEISENSQDESVTWKELMISTGRTPASERIDDRLKMRTTPCSIAMDDDMVNDVYTFKKNMVEALIQERDKRTHLAPEQYTQQFMSEFISRVTYTAFDFECFYNEYEYNSMEDWTINNSTRLNEYARDREGSSIVATGYTTAIVKKRHEPEEWVKTKVDFAIIFKLDEKTGEYIVIDTDWDIPRSVAEEPEYKKLDVKNTYSLKEALDEVCDAPYVELKASEIG